MSNSKLQEPRWVLLDRATDLLVRQSAQTGRILGWTSDPLTCRCYPSKKAAEDSLKKVKLPNSKLVALPLSVFI